MKLPEQEPPAETPLIPRMLAALVAAACRFPWTLLALVACTVVLSLIAASRRLEYRTSRNDLLSPHKECQQRWQRYLDEFGIDDDLVVVVEGTDRLRMSQALDTVAASVRACPELFDRLFYRVDLRSLRNRALLYVEPSQLQTIRNQLAEMAPLLDLGWLGWRGLSLGSLVQEAQRRPLEGETAFWRQLHAVTDSASAALREPTEFQNPWLALQPEDAGRRNLLEEPQYFFNADGTLAFLLVRPILDSGSFTAARRSVEAVRECLAAAREKFPDLRFGLTGMPVLENDEMVATQEDTNRAGWLALAGIALLYLVVYRGLRYPLLTVATLLVGTVWALGWLTLTVGHLNILSATFAIMLIGMGDYGVLWVTRYDQERATGADPVQALRATAQGVGPGILTAAVTTALAFFAAMLADFQAVTELGWIAGSGVLFCALACFTVLPALLVVAARCDTSSPSCSAILPPREGASGRNTARPLQRKEGRILAFPEPEAAGWLPLLTRRPRWVVAMFLAVTALLGCGALAVSYDHNLLHMQAHGLESVQWELKLIERTAGASWHALSYRTDREEALRLKAQFEKLPGVSHVVEVASLIPSDQERKLQLLRDVQTRLRHLPERDVDLEPITGRVADLQADLHTLRQRLESAADTTPCSDLVQRLAALEKQVADLAPETAAERIRDFNRKLARGLLATLHRLRDAAVPEPIRLEDLPADLRERHVSPSGHWLLRVFARECLWEFEPLGQFLQSIQSVDPTATGKPFTTYEGLAAMKRGFQGAALYALGAIVLVLALDFRSLRYTLLALTPLALGVAAALGILGLVGIPLNPANMIAFPLILGVGVENGVHVLHDFLARSRKTPYTLRCATGRGILVAALTTILGFGTLMIAQHRGQVGLGFTLSLGVTCCMLASLVFLPALLRLFTLSERAARTRATAPLSQRRAA